MSENNKTYIGDGVYAEVERGMVKLTTSDGIRTTNEVFLEPEVWNRLQTWFTANVREHPHPLVGFTSR
jgi:hypothetical protein